MGHAVIQVPVPALELVVRRHCVAANSGVHLPETAAVCAHITLLGPFVARQEVDDDLVSTIRKVLEPIRAFNFELSEVGHFLGGHIYLAPDPTEPFEQLTKLFAATFPDWPPYGGAFDDVVPHLSIGESLPEAELVALQERLPIAAAADEVTLTWWSDDSIGTLASFPLRRQRQDDHSMSD